MYKQYYEEPFTNYKTVYYVNILFGYSVYSIVDAKKNNSKSISIFDAFHTSGLNKFQYSIADNICACCVNDVRIRIRLAMSLILSSNTYQSEN